MPCLLDPWQHMQLRSSMKRDVLDPIESLSLLSNQTADKVEFLAAKVKNIEKHLPAMIQEILEYYFERKLEEMRMSLVDKKMFREALLTKTDQNLFQALEKRVMCDRTNTEKFHAIDTKLYSIDRSLMQCVTVEQLEHDLKDKPSFI